MYETRDERSLGSLFGELSRQASMLIRQEIQLAKVEVTESASRMGREAGMMAGGGLIAFVGFQAIIAAIIIGLAQFIPWWLSALFVGVVLVVIGYILLQQGLSALRKESLAPQQTIHSIKETAEWAREQVR